jgi:hypothetical protein
MRKTVCLSKGSMVVGSVLGFGEDEIRRKTGRLTDNADPILYLPDCLVIRVTG